MRQIEIGRAQKALHTGEAPERRLDTLTGSASRIRAAGNVGVDEGATGSRKVPARHARIAICVGRVRARQRNDDDQGATARPRFARSRCGDVCSYRSCLHQQWFKNLADAKMIIAAWRCHCNDARRIDRSVTNHRPCSKNRPLNTMRKYRLFRRTSGLGKARPALLAALSTSEQQSYAVIGYFV